MKRWTLVVFFTVAQAEASSLFVALGDFPGGQFASYASAISGDGAIVVGGGSRLESDTSDAFYWTETTGMVNLQSLPVSGAYLTSATSVALDGTVVGVISNRVDPKKSGEAFRWTVAHGFEELGYLPGGAGARSEASDVSRDASVIVGASDSPNGFLEAFRWTRETGMVGLGDLPGSHYLSHASAISGDGAIIVGTSYTDIGQQAFRWDADSGMVPLLDNEGQPFWSQAIDISTDGRVVIGNAIFDEVSRTTEAFRWTEDSGLQPLGDLPGGKFESSAVAASGDGSVIVGSSAVFPFDPSHQLLEDKAFVWDAAHRMRDLQQLLVEEYGLGESLTGWQLISAVDISDDGLSIAGNGFNPDGNFEAWLVRLDRPITASEPTALALLFLAAVRWIGNRGQRTS